jgi:thiamine-phosphate pyrophosphorylase
VRRLPDLALYLVTDPGLCAARGLLATVLAAVAGGAGVVQLRDKAADDAELTRLARALKAALAPVGVPLVVNDRVGVAVAAGADGLHIGQQDGDLHAARAAIGPEMLLGLSIENAAQASGIDPAAVDYIGAGPVFDTGTKPDAAPALGLAGLAAVCRAAPVPAVAIGGIGPGNARAAVEAGAAGVAVVSAICAADDPRSAAARLRRAVMEARR